MKNNDCVNYSYVDDSPIEPEANAQPRAKRRKSSETNFLKIYIICQKQYFCKDNKLFRLCEDHQANLLLSATRFNLDNAYSRTSLYETKEKLFAEDIFKVASVTFLLVCFLSLKKNTCETRKNAFYFTSKAQSLENQNLEF